MVLVEGFFFADLWSLLKLECDHMIDIRKLKPKMLFSVLFFRFSFVRI